jgi:hypothetical protein
MVMMMTVMMLVVVALYLQQLQLLFGCIVALSPV